jgi:hypothetical protein
MINDRKMSSRNALSEIQPKAGNNKRAAEDLSKKSVKRVKLSMEKLNLSTATPPNFYKNITLPEEDDVLHSKNETPNDRTVWIFLRIVIPFVAKFVHFWRPE